VKLERNCAVPPENNEEPNDDIAQRPDFLPEKFWNTDKGEVRLEEMATSYATAEKAVSSRLEQLAEDRKDSIDEAARDAIKLELSEGLETDRLANRPDDPGTYDIGEMPEYFEKEKIENGSLVAWWREHAHGLSQDEFKTGMDAYMNYIAADLPDPAKEMDSLGENARVRTDAVELWSKRVFKDPGELVEIQALGATALGVRALERVMEMVKGTAPSRVADEGELGGDDKITVEKAREMMADPKYYDSARRDPEWVAKVNAAFQ
jgi:hypothetical protein